MPSVCWQWETFSPGRALLGPSRPGENAWDARGAGSPRPLAGHWQLPLLGSEDGIVGDGEKPTDGRVPQMLPVKTKLFYFFIF